MTEITAFCFVLLALTVFVASPLYRTREGTHAALPATEDPTQQRLDEALVELEVDRASGLLDEEGYRAEKSALSDLHPSRDDPGVD